MKHAGRQLYGGCRLGTESLEDQLERADDGSWQIADRYAMASSAARGVAVFDFRVRFMLEPQLVLQPCASRDRRRHGGAPPRSSRTTRSSVNILTTQITWSIC